MGDGRIILDVRSARWDVEVTLALKGLKSAVQRPHMIVRRYPEAMESLSSPCTELDSTTNLTKRQYPDPGRAGSPQGKIHHFKRGGFRWRFLGDFPAVTKLFDVYENRLERGIDRGILL